MLVSEVARIQAHLRGAEVLVEAGPAVGLGPLRRLTRRLLLEELALYRERGVFPKNRDFLDERRPYFVDADGTRCAMAHLMEIGGAGDLVAEIAGTNNNAYVSELAADERFVAWLDAAGLTVEEAAAIQPGYRCAPPQDCLCQDLGDAEVVVYEGTVIEDAPDQARSRLQIDVVYGEASFVSPGAIVELPWRGHRAGDRMLGLARPANGGDAGTDASVSTSTVSVEPVTTIEPGNVIGPACLRGIGGPMYMPGTLGPLSTSDAARLLVSSPDACKAELAGIDACWAVNSCESQGEPHARCRDTPATPSSSDGAEPLASSTSSSGCATAGAHGSASSALVVAILGALLARARRRAGQRSE